MPSYDVYWAEYIPIQPRLAKALGLSRCNGEAERLKIALALARALEIPQEPLEHEGLDFVLGMQGRLEELLDQDDRTGNMREMAQVIAQEAVPPTHEDTLLVLLQCGWSRFSPVIQAEDVNHLMDEVSSHAQRRMHFHVSQMLDQWRIRGWDFDDPPAEEEPRPRRVIRSDNARPMGTGGSGPRAATGLVLVLVLVLIRVRPSRQDCFHSYLRR